MSVITQVLSTHNVHVHLLTLFSPHFKFFTQGKPEDKYKWISRNKWSRIIIILLILWCTEIVQSMLLVSQGSTNLHLPVMEILLTGSNFELILLEIKHHNLST